MHRYIIHSSHVLAKRAVCIVSLKQRLMYSMSASKPFFVWKVDDAERSILDT